MYEYRKMTPEERRDALLARLERGFPLHAPPHLRKLGGVYLITAACYEHSPIFDCPEDLSFLSGEVLRALGSAQVECTAWVFPPNHYHLLLQIEDLAFLSELLRRTHSRVATKINSRHHKRGRQVWYGFSDRLVRNERHWSTTLDYIHYNPVKHGYIDHMEDWPWSSVHVYQEVQGEEWIKSNWREHPLLDYGKGWDWQPAT